MPCGAAAPDWRLSAISSRWETACSLPDAGAVEPTIPIDRPLAASSRARSASPARLGVTCGASQIRKRGHGGEDLLDDRGVVGGSVAEPGRELPLGDRVGDRGQVAHPGEVQLRGCRGQDVGVGDEHVRPSRHDGAFRAGDDEDAAVRDETVDAAGGLDRDVAAAGALRGDLRDVGERARAHRDQQPVVHRLRPRRARRSPRRRGPCPCRAG